MIYSSAIAAGASILFVAVAATVWGELSPPLKEALKNITGHHWITKGIGSLIVFGIFFALAYVWGRNISVDKIRMSFRLLFFITIAATFVIFLFFVWHYGWG